MVNCEFQNCVYWDSDTNTTINCDNSVKPISNWNFSKIVCSGDLNFSTSSVPAYISTTTGDFYVQKTFDYGQVLILAFLIPAVFLILAFGIRKILIHKFLNG